MAITDVPVSGLTGGDPTLTHCLAICCLALQLLHVGCHSTLNSGVVGSGLVGQEHSVVLFDHATTIGHGRGSGGISGHLLEWHNLI